MTEVLRVMQVLMVCAWGLPLVLFAKYAWRKARGPFDTLRAAIWTVALSVMLFPVRWFVMGTAIAGMQPRELAVWSALYVLGTLAALFVTSATWDVSRGHE
jgi:hypothetical protein